MMVTSSLRLGLRLAGHRPIAAPSLQALTASFFTPPTTTSKRSLSSTGVINPRALPRSKFSALAVNLPTATSTPSSFFTPSLCRVRHASTTATATSTSPASSRTVPPSQALDWNSFFALRTSRRRYSLASSILATIASTASTMTFLTTYPTQADDLLKFIPTDPIISTGIAVFASMFVGWLLGPIFGNSVWRVLYRRQLPSFNIKEKGFYERIRKHRVNPTGAGANNPVPDFYGERIQSVAGYRLWLKDQRAFNRKRAGKQQAISF